MSWDIPWDHGEPGPRPSGQPFHPFTLGDLERLDIPELEHDVDGVIASGSLVLLVGREKEGKSLVLIDLLSSLADGDTAWGRTTVRRPVLYCPAEDSIRTVRDRLRGRLGSRGRMLTGLPFHVLPLSGVTLDADHPGGVLSLENPESIQRLREAITATGAQVIGIDTLREVHSGRENESDDMGSRMRALRRVAHELGVTIIVVHHASKGIGGGSRGSTAIAAGCDAVAIWTADGDGDDDGPIRGRLTVKGRDVPRTTLRLEMTKDLRFVPIDEPVDLAGADAPRKIVDALTRRGELTADAIAQATGMAAKTVQNRTSVMLRSVPVQIERFGTGRRNDPFRYRLVSSLVSSQGPSDDHPNNTPPSDRVGRDRDETGTQSGSEMPGTMRLLRNGSRTGDDTGTKPRDETVYSPLGDALRDIGSRDETDPDGWEAF